MRYKIMYDDGYWCIFRCERIGNRIVLACRTRKEAERYVEEFKEGDRKREVRYETV